ncbi:MAG: hypothetical protein RL701_6196 [Pseudomonadota bacterium]|jgi:hypothetical protein
MKLADTPLTVEAESWTRQQVAHRLQISVSSVRRLEGTRLQPVQDEAGVWRFEPAEVEELVQDGPVKRRRAPERHRDCQNAGEAAAHVFRLFGAGKSLRDIVVEARQTPERVRELYREWLLGLREGERRRHERLERERERREQMEDERAHFGDDPSAKNLGC